ncbi:MAG: transporter substrate-binding protein, partial [Devosia sp.]|uniref:ABC transporter substrate-binding protein n=1 Tax=Devosia sp. TaxID=1871048 RepID=UPI0026389B47
AKDADGFWYGDYYGVLAFGVNKSIVTTTPTSWADLQKPDYANSVALAGDPRTANNAILSVYAAGLSTGADAAGAADAGLQFFKALNDKGNFVPVDAEASAIAQGTTPIAVNWDYNLLAQRDGFEGNPEMDVVVPSDGVLAGVYIQAISAYAPHPNAAKLWMEYLYSDEGQLGWLAGYCHPIRFNDLASKGGLPADLMAKLPAADNYAKAVFPTLEEQNAAKTQISSQWDTVVGAKIN